MRRLVRYKVLTDAGEEVGSSFANVTGITTSAKKRINYPRSEALSDGIFHVEKLPNFKSGKS